MQFSTLALAAFLTASASAACPPRQGFHGSNGTRTRRPTSYPSFTRSSEPSASAPVVSYSAAAPEPTTLTSIVVPVVPSTSDVVVTPTSSEVTVAATTSSSSSAAASATAPASDAGLSADQSSALSSQNSARSDVGAAALVWDAGLASDAQTWADHLAAQNSPGSLVHDQQSGEGENLYWSSQSDGPYEAAAAAWIAEKSSYNGEAITGSGNFENYGHYTQIIWSTTTNVGMAIADDGQGGVYVVARYSPPGNMIGSTPAEGS